MGILRNGASPAAQGRCSCRLTTTFMVALAAFTLQAHIGWAAIYNVGDRPAGAVTWTLPPVTNYNTWASAKSFRVNDVLRFAYPSEVHNVMRVNKIDYDSCSNHRPLAVYTNGATLVHLTAPGTYYFICGVPGHCDAGMKMQVTVR